MFSRKEAVLKYKIHKGVIVSEEADKPKYYPCQVRLVEVVIDNI
jgi:hypothetical protein